MKFYGELFTFILLFITNFRVFFVKQVKKDPLVSLAPISFFVSILQIVAWGFDLFTALAFIISFLVLISNFHAIFRYSENLYIDHYSPLMKFWAIFTTLLSVFGSNSFPTFVSTGSNNFTPFSSAFFITD